MSIFKRATKEQSKARILFSGPGGSGKTWNALVTATQLGSRIAFVDTENRSASKYADKFVFYEISINQYEPQYIINLIQEAEREKYDVLIIDSLTHTWQRVLEMVETAAQKSSSKNTFGEWKTYSPQWEALMRKILSSSIHIIATTRSKIEYVLEENDRGRKVPVKKGMASQIRSGSDYEFDIVIEVDIDHKAWASKTRCDELDGKVWLKDNGEIGRIIRNWCETGTDPSPMPTFTHNPPPSQDAASDKLTTFKTKWSDDELNDPEIVELNTLRTAAQKELEYHGNFTYQLNLYCQATNPGLKHWKQLPLKKLKMLSDKSAVANKIKPAVTKWCNENNVSTLWRPMTEAEEIEVMSSEDGQ